ncbi:glutaredoxin 3 [Paracoccus marinaquae]|uniref:Glutaredoxin n=1 Tax=Paracoccus marinaquae TaxID=2841926 RepID=A0ABS6AL01_9RHOB|nr:glutaredoxin 3 [Paracoccus marinaquae]MBU3031248.1 glutaredoxin 3 [Paracoccus marinaquae]
MPPKPQVEIYLTQTCPFCIAARSLLRRKGVEFTEIDVGARPERRAEMTQRAHGRRTVPQIFVGETHVGGSDDLHALERDGRLDPLLQGRAA